MPILDQLEHVLIDFIVVIRSDRRRSTLDTADLQRSISKSASSTRRSFEKMTF